ncbi:MAG: response regulator [Mucinivorans sp.]
MRRNILLIICLFLTLPSFAYIEKDLHKLTMQNGMPDNTIFSIARDEQGFMWFATENGLTRYDGSMLKVYRFPKPKGSFFTNIINIWSGKLWLQSYGRLECFDQRSENFLSVRDSALRVKYNLNRYEIIGDSIIWCMGDKVLLGARLTIDGRKGEVTLDPFVVYDKLVAANNRLSAICLDDVGNLYVVTSDHRIISRRAATGKFDERRFALQVSTFGANSVVSGVDYIDGSLWLNTMGAGVARYFLDTDICQQIDDIPNERGLFIQHASVYQVARVARNKYIAVTWDGYSTINYDSTDRQIESVDNYPTLYSELHRNIERRMGCVYIDEDRTLWIGTFGGGVLMSRLSEQFFHKYNFNRANEINSMVIDGQGYLWITKFHSGVERSVQPFDRSSTLSFKEVYRKPAGQVTRPPMCLARNQAGRVFGGTSYGTLVTLGKNGVESEREIKLQGNPSLKLQIQTLYFDSGDRLLVGTDRGVLVCEKDNLYLARTMRGTEKMSVVSLSKDPSGYLWIAHYDGATRLDMARGDTMNFARNRWVTSVIASDPDQVYLGTTKGMMVVQPKQIKNRERLYTTWDGLCNNFVACMASGDQGEIWMGSNSGVSRFSRSEKVFYNYYIQGNTRSVTMSPKGMLIWGNNNGLSSFDPRLLNDFYKRLSNRQVRITDIEIGGRLICAGDTIAGKVILDRSMPFTDHIVLGPDNNNFSLHVSNLFFNPTYQNYAYRLLPIQNEWISIGQGERISYVALPAGRYLFQVKSQANSNNQIPITELAITIEPYWFFSWWVKTIASLIVVGFIVYVFRRYSIKYKRQLYINRMREQLRTQRVELEQEQQLHAERVEFFTYASHELRTPLTLLISPVQDLLSQPNITPPVRGQLKIIERNALQMSDMISKLLYIKKIDSNMVKLDLAQVDLWQIVERVVASFEQLAREKSVDIQASNLTGDDKILVWVDEAKIESAITNLVSNSFKYRADHDPMVRISVELIESKDVAYQVVKVEDNGQGISPDKQATIFDSFVTDNNQPLFSTKVGMGLSIVRSLIELHHGRVTLESQVGRGSAFMLYIPRDNYHFQHTPSLQAAMNQHTNSWAPKPKILVVDDNVEILDYVCSLFDGDYTVLRADTGEDGMRLALGELPDLILQDVMLPGISGIECCRLLNEQAETSHIPVILLSAIADEATVVEGTVVGAADYIAKPFNPKILKAKVATLIHSRAMLRQVYAKSLMLVADQKTDQARDDNFMQKIINITQNNLQSADFGVDMLSEKLAMSSSTLRRTLKAYTPLSANELIRSVRLTKAASLLMEQKYRVNEIAELVGYNDLSTFRTQFTRKFGVSPSKFHLDNSTAGKV